MAEKGTTQAKETYDKTDAATTEAAYLIKNSYSKAVKGMHKVTRATAEPPKMGVSNPFNIAS